MVEEWIRFDWSAQRAQLERAVQAGREAGKQTMQRRKQLSEQTKAFKKATKNREDTKEWTPLIRAYQGEIDALTTRCKAAEGSLTTFCGTWMEMTDPAQVFQDQQSQMTQLLQTMDQLNQELQQLCSAVCSR